MDWQKADNVRLIKAILTLDTPTAARNFLRDLMTAGEIAEFAKRLKAAEMLSQSVPYTTIEKQTGLSSTTVARVSKWLNGRLGGYRRVIAKLHHHSPTQLRRGLS